MHMFANLLPKLGVAALVLALLGADSGAPFRQPAIGAAAAAFEGESATDQPPSVETRPTDLTEREREVVRLVAQGRNNAEIARKLVISDKTVKTHVSNILSKLNLEDRTQLAIYAIKNGLVDSP